MRLIPTQALCFCCSLQSTANSKQIHKRQSQVLKRAAPRNRRGIILQVHKETLPRAAKPDPHTAHTPMFTVTLRRQRQSSPPHGHTHVSIPKITFAAVGFGSGPIDPDTDCPLLVVHLTRTIEVKDGQLLLGLYQWLAVRWSSRTQPEALMLGQSLEQTSRHRSLYLSRSVIVVYSHLFEPVSPSHAA